MSPDDPSSGRLRSKSNSPYLWRRPSVSAALLSLESLSAREPLRADLFCTDEEGRVGGGAARTVGGMPFWEFREVLVWLVFSLTPASSKCSPELLSDGELSCSPESNAPTPAPAGGTALPFRCELFVLRRKGGSLEARRGFSEMAAAAGATSWEDVGCGGLSQPMSSKLGTSLLGLCDNESNGVSSETVGGTGRRTPKLSMLGGGG